MTENTTNAINNPGIRAFVDFDKEDIKKLLTLTDNSSEKLSDALGEKIKNIITNDDEFKKIELKGRELEELKIFLENQGFNELNEKIPEAANISDLTEDIVDVIIDEFLELPDQKALSAVSLGLFNHLKDKITPVLLDHVVKGEEDAVVKICKINPKLLYLSKATAIDYSGRTVTMTPLQAMIAAGDTDMLDAVIKHIPNGQKIVSEQIQEMFPKGVEDYFKEQKPFDFAPIIAAIIKANDQEVQNALDLNGASFTETEEAKTKADKDLSLTEALNRFREQFSKRSHKDKIFNPNHLLQAHTIYNTEFDNWNWNQRDLFWRQVIGYTQRYVPACFGQAFAQGIYSIVEEGEKLRRSFKLERVIDSFYPVNFDSCSDLGFNYAVAVGRALSQAVYRSEDVGTIFKIMSSKNKKLGRLMQNYTQNKTKSWCVVS